MAWKRIYCARSTDARTGTEKSSETLGPPKPFSLWHCHIPTDRIFKNQNGNYNLNKTIQIEVRATCDTTEHLNVFLLFLRFSSSLLVRSLPMILG